MNATLSPDSLHRTAKAMMDSSQARTAEEALAHLMGFRLAITISRQAATSPTVQAALLTAVTCARRCFLGGVTVDGVGSAPLLVCMPGCTTVAEAVVHLGGRCGPDAHEPSVTVAFGDGDVRSQQPILRPTFNGWCGGVLGLDGSARLDETQENHLTGVFIGAVAVAEAFQIVTQSNPMAGRRDLGLSLWDPRPEIDWRCAPAGPPIDYLPASAWLIGLGHLGQAYLWTLGMLPYATPSDVHLTLQDYDRVVLANDSTSPLTTPDLVGSLKTRAMAHWCEQRGFGTRLIERPFSSHLRVEGDDPRVALCGVDNAAARACLEDVGFDLVVEAGLGKGWNDYLDLQIHTFPSPVRAAERWQRRPLEPQTVPAAPSYAHLAATGMDDCGLLQLASRSVGAAFVGCATASLAIAELVRGLHGGVRHALVDLSLRDPTHRAAVVVQPACASAVAFTRSG